jgi:hypothetical protein
MKTGVVRMIGILLWSTCIAVQAQKGESVMFGDDMPSLKPGAAEAGGDRCEALWREIQTLKGKPQRHMAAMEIYEAECQRAPVREPPSTPTD